MRCGNPGSTRCLLDYHSETANAQPLRRDGRWTSAPLATSKKTPCGSTNQSFLDHFVERTNSPDHPPNQLDDSLHSNQMLWVERRLHGQ